MSARGLAGRMRAAELRNWSCLGYCHNWNQMQESLNFSLRSQWVKVLTVSPVNAAFSMKSWRSFWEITNRCYVNALIAQFALLVLKLHIPMSFPIKKGLQKSSLELVNVQACIHTAESPRAGKMAGQEITRSRSTRGKGWEAMEESRANPAKSLNPVEFLSSSAAPLGGVRSLWRERGKTGPVRNKAPNSHDMFS